MPDRTAVERADVTRTPIAISAPDSAVALAYGKLADHLQRTGSAPSSWLRARGLQIDAPLARAAQAAAIARRTSTPSDTQGPR